MKKEIIVIGGLLCLILTLGCIKEPAVNIWSECRNDSANVFIGANEDIKEVRCVAIDRELVENSEIVIGDLRKNDEDVCRFRLSKGTTQPLRFEVWYNNKVEREVCDWQHYSGSMID